MFRVYECQSKSLNTGKNRVLAFSNKSNIEIRDARWPSQIQTCLLGVSLPKSVFPVPVLVASGHTKIALVPHLSPKREVFEKFELSFDYCFPYPRSRLTCHRLCSVCLMSEPNYLEQKTLALHSMGNWAITSQNDRKKFFSRKHQRAFLHDALAMQRFQSCFWCRSKA